MKSARIPKPDQIEIVDFPDPEPGPGQAVIKVMAAGICGTDLHIFRGEYLGSYPVIPGHEFSGEVVAVGPGVTRFTTGDRVAVEPNISCNDCVACLNNRENFCRNWQAVGVTLPGGMSQYVVVPENAMFSIDDLPFEQAAFMEPLSCVIHGVERAGIRLGDKVAIWGAGPIGLMMLQLVRLQGATQVAVADLNLSRAELARQLGADVASGDMQVFEKDYFDVVIDATGAIPVMASAIDYVRPGGTVLWFGVPPAHQKIELEPFLMFQKGLKVVTSYTSLRNSYQAIDLLASGRVNVVPIISHQLPLEEFPNALHMLESRQPGVEKVIIRPNGR